jgi:hypothetical protein
MNHPAPALQLSLRTNAQNPDHHLWNNHGTWWCHITVHTSDGAKHRVRRSLRTHSPDQALRRRDDLLHRLNAATLLRNAA